MVPPLTPEQAAAPRRLTSMIVCEQLARHDRIVPVLMGTPDNRLSDFARLVGHTLKEYRSREHGAPGRRLTNATVGAFEGGAQRVILFGADSPTLSEAMITKAVDQLDASDAVLGPCRDGGYYLLAMRRPIVALFDRIDWGGRDVSQQTVDRADEAGIKVAVLEEWYDLDRLDDLPRAANDLAAMSPAEGTAAAGNLALLWRLTKEH
ncbi:MAG: glycosyltransferase [Phycisphaerales bacterium]|nr:MAG: glycosyltransferase [Phycisphaerales bacterium]